MSVKTRKKVLTVLVLAALLFAIMASAFFTVTDAKAVTGYDANCWKDSLGEYVVPTDNKVRMPDAEMLPDNVKKDGGMFYTENLANKEYYEEYNALYLKVDFIATKDAVDYLANQVIFFINCKEMTDMSSTKTFGTEAATSMGPRTYLQNETQWNENKYLARLSDYKNYQTATWGSLTSADVHNISWLIDSTGVYTFIDDKPVMSGGKAYKAQKAEGVLWTLSDFIDENDEPVLFFGCYSGSSAGWIDVDIVNLTTSNGLSTVQDFKGLPENLYVENESVYLKDGYAYAKDSLNLNKTVSGKIDIKQTPGYSVDLGAENETYASVLIKDSNKNESDGNGFRINWYPLSEQGKDRTKIEVGYIIDGVFKSSKTIISSIPVVGVHNFAIVAGEDWFSIIVDGESVFFGMMSSSDLLSLSQKMNTEEIYVFYSLDSDYAEPFSGQWLTLLTAPVVNEFEDFRVFGLESTDYEITGELTKEAKEVDGKSYDTVVSNKSLAVTGAKGIIAVSAVTPTVIWSRINELIDVKVKMADLAQITEGASITLMLSATEGGSFTTDVAVSSFKAEIVFADSTKIKVTSSMESATSTKEVNITDGEFTVTFGWRNNCSIIDVDGVNMLKSSMTTGGFASAYGTMAYFTAKTVSDSPLNYTLTAPTQKVSRIVEETDPGEGEGEDPGEKPGGNGCGSSVMFSDLYTVVLMLASVAFIVTVKKSAKKIKK